MQAITNVLLLRGDVSLPAPTFGRQYISYEELKELLHGYLAAHPAPRQGKSTSAAQRMAHSRAVSETATLLETGELMSGLDVNLRFDGTDDFEFTQEVACFDAFSVELRHGWLPHPTEEAALLRAMNSRSYNELVASDAVTLSLRQDEEDVVEREEEVLEMGADGTFDASGLPAKPYLSALPQASQPTKVSDIQRIDDFLKSAQLTEHGLAVCRPLRPNSPCTLPDLTVIS
jgi:hypothetical protein